MNDNSDVVKRVSQLHFGDLIEVNWWDHSKREIRLKKKGKKQYIYFDVPAQSAGYFFGVAGEETDHIILARDVFTWPHMGDFDADAVAIMIVATKDVKIAKRHALHQRLGRKVVMDLKAAWEKGQVRIVKHGKRIHLRFGLGANNNEKPHS